uniref:Carbamoyl phosphate synthase small chain n=1 Tax=Spyridia filamentosa TaxID=196632 RepID=A0A1Z1MK23_SPYFI|nr:carbamoyl phosphate synthase small subunit [Spyridia filamentosa]ARW66111.1 carbamoyl phosphate synthase small subunit [Spyridia filamentosa]
MNKMFYSTSLCLEDGTFYKGWSFCNFATSSGEIVFNTGMTGYQEIFTDPSYFGQMVVFTYPELGNTGINIDDNESYAFHAQAIIAKDICAYPNNWRSKIALSDYLRMQSIPHIFGIDTRSLVRYLRLNGSMNGLIFNSLEYKFSPESFIDLPSMQGLDLVHRISTSRPYSVNLKDCKSMQFFYYNDLYTRDSFQDFFNVVIIDFGVKNSIISRLMSYNCNINVLPATSTYETICSYNPDGIVLSNGPGDPSSLSYVLDTVKKIIHFSQIPIFGICMGHQILSLASDFQAFKLIFGHRGLNHPVSMSQRSEITSQNHGFAIKVHCSKSHTETMKIMSWNLNDLTVAGIFHLTKPIFSVQYHPEAHPGPHDSDYLFSHFIKLMKNFKISMQ